MAIKRQAREYVTPSGIDRGARGDKGNSRPRLCGNVLVDRRTL